jgi:thioredoxin-related protein
VPCALAAGEAVLEPANDLARDARAMRAGRYPMLVLYSQHDCAWCERARREYLAPMGRDPAWRGKLVLRQIDIDSHDALTDFAGHATSHGEFAAAEKARVTPTVVVYGPDGARLAEPIVGFRLPDFYGSYLERAVEEGLAKLRRK